MLIGHRYCSNESDPIEGSRFDPDYVANVKFLLSLEKPSLLINAVMVEKRKCLLNKGVIMMYQMQSEFFGWRGRRAEMQTSGPGPGAAVIVPLTAAPDRIRQ